jgi:hypothetical protein
MCRIRRALTAQGRGVYNGTCLGVKQVPDTDEVSDVDLLHERPPRCEMSRHADGYPQAQTDHLEVQLRAERQRRMRAEAELQALRTELAAQRAHSKVRQSGWRTLLFQRNTALPTLEEESSMTPSAGPSLEESEEGASDERDGSAQSAGRLLSAGNKASDASGDNDMAEKEPARPLAARVVYVISAAVALAVLFAIVAITALVPPPRQPDFASAPRIVPGSVTPSTFAINASLSMDGWISYVVVPTADLLDLVSASNATVTSSDVLNVVQEVSAARLLPVRMLGVRVETLPNQCLRPDEQESSSSPALFPLFEHAQAGMLGPCLACLDPQLCAVAVQVTHACGDAPAAANQALILSVQDSGGSTAECLSTGAAAALDTSAAPSRDAGAQSCWRCPQLLPETNYTFLAVGASGVPQLLYATTGVSQLRLVTGDGAPPTWLAAPLVSDVGLDSVTLSLSLSEAGTVHFAVSLVTVSGLFFSQYLLNFPTTPALAADTIGAPWSGRAQLQHNGVIARGSVRVASQLDTRLVITAPCLLDACDVVENTRQTLFSPATAYHVALLAQDDDGNVQGACNRSLSSAGAAWSA